MPTHRFKYWKGELAGDQLLSNRFIPDGAVVMATGGIVENLHNPYSDIDLLCITDDPVKVSDLAASGVVPLIVEFGSGSEDVVGQSVMGEELRSKGESLMDARIFATHDYVDEWGTRCDVEYVTWDWIDETRSLIERECRAAGSRYGHVPLPVSWVEGRRIHRLFNHQILQGTRRCAAFEDHDLRLAFCYCLARYQMTSYAYFQDILGALRGGQWEMAYELARRFLINNTMCYLHVCGCTNIADKWLSQNLRRWAKAEDADLVGRISAFLWGGRTTPVDRSTVEEALNLSDALVRRTVAELAHPAFPPLDGAQAALHSRFKSMNRTDPHAVLGLEYYSRFFRSAGGLSFRDFADREGGLSLQHSSL